MDIRLFPGQHRGRPYGPPYVALNSYSGDHGSISVLDPTDLVESGTISGLSDFAGLYGIAVGNDGREYVLGYKYGAGGIPASTLVSVSADGASVTKLVDLGPGSGAIDVEIGTGDGHSV